MAIARKSLLSVIFLINLNCGDGLDETNTGGRASEKIAVTTMKTNLDGTRTPVTTYRTQEQMNEAVRRKTEYFRLKAEGIEPLWEDPTCPSHLNWLFDGQNLQGGVCCVDGTGWDWIWVLCGGPEHYTFKQSLYAGQYAGSVWGGPCQEPFWPAERHDSFWCPAVDQLEQYP